MMFVVCVCTGRVCSGGGGAGDVCCVCTGSVCSGGGGAGAGDVCCVCVQGVCAPAEVELVDGEGATEFVEAEGGGFDEGQGAKNVSSEVDAENLVSMLVHQYARTPHSNGTIGCYLFTLGSIHAHICIDMCMHVM